MKEHEREQPGHLSRGLSPLSARTTRVEANGVGRQVRANQRSAAGRGVPFVEHQVEHREHGVQTLGHLARLWYDVRNAAHQRSCASPARTVAPSSPRDQESASDLLCLEADERAQRERDLGLEGEGRVTAGEDQA